MSLYMKGKKPSHKKHLVRRVVRALNVVLWFAIAGAVIPQILFAFYVYYLNPGVELTWQVRDQFLLFSAVGNLAMVILSVCSLILVQVLGSRMDTYDQILERGLKDMDKVRRKLKRVTGDIDDVYPTVAKMVTFAKANQQNIHDTVDMMNHIMPLVNVIKKQYGKKIKKIDDLTDKQKEMLVHEIVDGLFNK